jgi:hypothetical protein
MEWGVGGSDFRKPMTCEYIGKQRSSGENAGIVTGGLEIELTGASTVLHDVAVERQPPPHLPNRSPCFGSWRDQVTRHLIEFDTMGYPNIFATVNDDTESGQSLWSIGYLGWACSVNGEDEKYVAQFFVGRSICDLE